MKLQIPERGTKLSMRLFKISRTLFIPPLTLSIHLHQTIFDSVLLTKLVPFDNREAMVKFGQPMDDKELETLVQTADANKDGKIDYVEFARLLLEQNGSNDNPNRSCATNHSKEKTASS